MEGNNIQGKALMKLFPFKNLPSKPITVTLPKVNMRIHIKPIRHWLQRQTVNSWFNVTVLEGTVNKHPSFDIEEHPEPYMIHLSKRQLSILRESMDMKMDSPSLVIEKALHKLCSENEHSDES